MYSLKQSLLACGYTGPCESLNILKWAIRAGASSQFFNDLVHWLESQLKLVVLTYQARDNITRVLSMLRQSILMKPSYGSDSALNPKEFRLQALKVLTRQVELRRPPAQMQCLNEESLQIDCGNVHSPYRPLTITLNMNKKTNSGDGNQRLVRLNTNYYEKKTCQ